MDRKASSVSEWSMVDPDFAELLKEVSRNTANVFMGPWSVDIVDVEGPGFRVAYEGSGKLGMAAAVPVAEDGYFLTVAHAVETAERLTLVAWVEDKDFSGPRQATPRVVWAPGRGRDPDIALLHADLAPVQAFEMADMPYLTQPVGVTGSSAMMRLAIHRGTESQLTRFSSVAIGRVSKVGKARGGRQGPTYRLVRHSAPTVHGDSGGALVDEQGSLLGINSTVHPPSWLGWIPYVGVRMSAAIDGVSFQSQAIRPDDAWLRNLIEADRRRIGLRGDEADGRNVIDATIDASTG
ncbi:MAG: serine protease [Gammaproteobacteria bacterium]|nr:serine protease [Gammaproteobacteria bacterium]